MSWKRLITSGSKAAIKSLSVNFDSNSGTGVISASNKIFALSAVPSTISGELDVVIISGSGTDAGIGTFEHTGSDKFSRVFGSDLTISGDLKPNGGTFDGSLVVQLSAETGSVSNTLSGDGLKGGDGTAGNPIESINILKGTKPNLSISSTTVSVSSSLISNAAEVDNAVAGEKGIFYNTLTDKIGLQIHNNLKFIINSGGGNLAKKAPNESGGLTGLGLTAANGIDSTALNTFNYSADKVVIFDSASLIVDSAGSYGALKAHNNVISIRTGSISLSNTAAVAIDADEAFIGRIGLSDDGTTLTLGQVDELVTVAGNFQVQGTSTFAHSNNLETADKFILVNSGSAPAVTQNFGYQGMNGANSSIQMGFTASVASNNLEGRGWRMGVGTATDSNLSNIKGNVRLHINSVNGDPNTKTFKPEEQMVGNTCRDSSAAEADSLFMYVPNP